MKTFFFAILLIMMSFALSSNTLAQGATGSGTYRTYNTNGDYFEYTPIWVPAGTLNYYLFVSCYPEPYGATSYALVTTVSDDSFGVDVSCSSSQSPNGVTKSGSMELDYDQEVDICLDISNGGISEVYLYW